MKAVKPDIENTIFVLDSRTRIRGKLWVKILRGPVPLQFIKFEKPKKKRKKRALA